MAVKQAQDNIASRLADPLSDTSEQLTLNYEFNNMVVPSTGFLLIGGSSVLTPSSDGVPPSGEVVKYEVFTRNGDGTSTFGETSVTPLTRGLRNSTAQAWDAGTPVGLGLSAMYMNLFLDAVEPMDNGSYIYKNIHADSKINDALVPGGVNELDIRDWYEKSDSGTVAPGNAGNIVTTSLANNETLEVNLATFIKPDGQAIPNGVNLVIATLDNAGGGTSRTTILSGDGSTIYDKITGWPQASYQNTSGSAQTVMIGADNGQWSAGSGSDVKIHVSVVAKVV